MDEPLLWASLLLCGGSLVLSLLLTPLARRLATRAQLVDQPGTRKIHRQTKPYGGGVAIYVTIALVLLGAYGVLAFGMGHVPEAWRDALVPHLPGILDPVTQRKLFAICAGATLVFLMGVVDDYRGVPPKMKLAIQILAGCLLVWGGVRITLFLESGWIGAGLTVAWVVLLTNGFNLLDNMDGLSAGVASVAAGLFFLIAVQAGQVFIASFLAVLLGAMLGFLWYNFSPASLFMGDAGSYLIGFLLSSLTVATTYYREQGVAFQVVMPVLILGVPLFDTCSVIVIRLRAGVSIFKGDTNHLSHRLVRVGFSRRGAVLTMYLLGLLLGGLAVLLRDLEDQTGVLLVLGLAFGIVVLMALLMQAAGDRPRDGGGLA